METKYNSNTYTDSFEHIGNCPSNNKEIKQLIVIDDGTGKLFTYEKSKYLEWKEYTIQPDFSTNPIKPTILDNTEIIPSITDSYDVVQEDGVDYNFDADGEQLEKQETETINQILSTPRNQTIIQTVRYFTGWEIKTAQMQKNIEKTNIAPEACNTISETGICSPKHIFTSCSTDQEDNPQNLIINWFVYKDNNSSVVYNEDTQEKSVEVGETDDWALIDTKENNPVFEYIYQSEGRYKLRETAIDSDSDSNSIDRIYNVLFEECGVEDEDGNAFSGKGSIEVEAGKWQIIAAPLENMYWDSNIHNFKRDANIRSNFYNCIYAQLKDRYNREPKELFKVANAYIGDINKFYNFVPGFTKENSSHNFNLIYIDTDDDAQNSKIKKEIVGFWVKGLDTNFTIEWEIK